MTEAETGYDIVMNGTAAMKRTAAREMLDAIEAMEKGVTLTPCPVCDGGGCDMCKGGGKVVVPNSIKRARQPVEAQLTEARRKKAYFGALRSMINFDAVTEDELRNALSTYWGRAVPDHLSHEELQAIAHDGTLDVFQLWDASKEEFHTKMKAVNKEFDEAITLFDKVISMATGILESAEEMRVNAQAFHTHLKLAAQRTMPQPEPEKVDVKLTKAAGRMCFQPHCERTENLVKDMSTGKAWCRKHAPKKLRRG